MNEIQLGPQLFIGRSAPAPHKMMPIQNYGEGALNKPITGGLWTSSYEMGTSAWERFIKLEYPAKAVGTQRFLLIPQFARVLEVRTVEDFINAPMLEEERIRQLDFEALAEEYDAIRLVKPFSIKEEDAITRLSRRDSVLIGFYYWSCESTIWFRWKFAGTPINLTPSNSMINMQKISLFPERDLYDL